MLNYSNKTSVDILTQTLFKLPYAITRRYIGWLSFLFIVLLFINDFLILRLQIISLLLVYALITGVFTFFWVRYDHDFSGKTSDPSPSEDKNLTNEKATTSRRFFKTCNILDIMHTLLSAVLSIFLFFTLLATSYDLSILWAVALIIIGILAFLFLPYQTLALLIFMQTISTMNFYGDNLDALINNISLIDTIDILKTLSIIIFSIVEGQRAKKKEELNRKETIKITLLPLAFFSIPYVFALLIDLLSQFPLFTKLHVAHFNATSFSLIFTLFYGLILGGLNYLYKEKRKWLLRLTFSGVLVTLLFFFPLKAQAGKYQERLLLMHNEFYQEAMADDGTIPWQKIILLEKSAEAGNPAAMYEVAFYYFTSDSAINITLEDIEKYTNYLYLSMILGNEDARKFLNLLAKGSVFPKSFFPSFQIDPVVYSVYYAKYYLCLDAVFNNGYYLEDIPQGQNLENLQYNMKRGKEILYELDSQKLSNHPTIALAEIDFIENNITSALEKFNRCVEENAPEALFALALHYYYGVKVEKDKVKAMEYLARAKNKNHQDSQFLWSVTMLNDSFAKEEDKDIARFLLMQLYSANHPGAKLNVALRWLRNDPYFSDVETEQTIENDEHFSQPQLITDEDKMVRGRAVLENIIYGGENVTFNTTGTSYMPEIMGKEIVLATYELARNLYYSDAKLKSARLLARPTQKGHQPSIKFLLKIVAEDPAIYSQLPSQGE